MRAVKTVLTLFAVIIMSVCFAACGGEDEPAPDPGDTPETFTVHSIDGLETLDLTITDGAYRTSIVGEWRPDRLLMVGFEGDDDNAMSAFMDELARSPYAIGSYKVTGNELRDVFGEILIIFIALGFHRIVRSWIKAAAHLPSHGRLKTSERCARRMTSLAIIILSKNTI